MIGDGRRKRENIVYLPGGIDIHILNDQRYLFPFRTLAKIKQKMNVMLKFIKMIESEQDIIGASKHYIVVAKK
jgi:hypothetical protein